MASEHFVKMLKKLDRVLMSNDPTVIDALKQAMVLTEISDDHDPHYIYPVGPLESLHNKLEHISNKLDMLMANRYQTGTGTYYTTNTTGSYWSEPGYGAVGSISIQDYMMQEVGIGANGSSEPLDAYKKYTDVMPASPTEEGAFVLFDPDTGDSMSVKYK